LGNFLNGNREISAVSEGTGRSGNGKAGNPDVNDAEKSDRSIVPEKAANEARAQEPLEGRGRSKENT
jgi:hypothetical protein